MPKYKKRDKPKWWIKAELGKRGITLRQLSIDNNYNESAMADALRRKSVPCEKIIAKAIGKQPQDIWPSRYAYQRHSKKNITRYKRVGNG